MGSKIQSVDVEKIMQEIRANIKERGYTPDMLSFDEVISDTEIKNGVSGKSVEYDEGALKQHLHLAAGLHNIPYYEPIAGGKGKVFVKRVIRKAMAFQMLPLRERQNHFNYNAVQSMYQLEAHIDALEAHIAELEDHILELEDVITNGETYIEKLETRIEISEMKK